MPGESQMGLKATSVGRASGPVDPFEDEQDARQTVRTGYRSGDHTVVRSA
jgi:hypothetical protein